MSGHNIKPILAGRGCAVLCVCFLLAPISAPLRGGQENASTPILKRMSNAFASVMEKVSPGLVGIRAERRMSRPTQEKSSAESLDPFRDDFFGYFFRRRTPQEESPPRAYVRQAQGSGFLISEEGHILTNNHVVENADKIMVELIDGRTVDAEVVGTDPESDVAVIRIRADKLTPVAWGIPTPWRWANGCWPSEIRWV